MFWDIFLAHKRKRNIVVVYFARERELFGVYFLRASASENFRGAFLVRQHGPPRRERVRQHANISAALDLRTPLGTYLSYQ